MYCLAYNTFTVVKYIKCTQASLRCIMTLCFDTGLRTNVRRAYAEFQPSFIEDHSKLQQFSKIDHKYDLYALRFSCSAWSSVAQTGIWSLLFPCCYPREEEIWSIGMEHQSMLLCYR